MEKHLPNPFFFVIGGILEVSSHLIPMHTSEGSPATLMDGRADRARQILQSQNE